MSGKSLKNYTFYLHQTKLIRSSLKHLLDREKRSKLCEVANRSCKVCESVKDTTKFQKAELEETFDVLKGPLDCNSTVRYIFLNTKNVSLNSVM